jgi:DNA-binding NarL/FixJ family response regulator
MKNVLVVDDSPAVRGAIRFVLEKQHGLAICSEAEDGVHGVTTAEVLKPDLILVDLAMPKLNGAAAASILKRILPGVPIILFTMYEEAVDALAPAIGVDMVLGKASGFNSLVRRVQELLHPCRSSEEFEAERSAADSNRGEEAVS